MKRYWLFVYSQYYPRGGMEDFVDSFDSVEECKALALKNLDNGGWYYHVYDSLINVISLYATDNTRSCQPVEITNIPINKLKDLIL